MDLKPYIYNNGFSKRYYVCSHCSSKAMKREHPPGFAPPQYLCMECGSVENAPTWENVAGNYVVEEEASEAWLSVEDLAELIFIEQNQKN